MTQNKGRSAPPVRMSLILVAAVAAIVAGYALLPDDRTRAATALRDGNFSDALSLFERVAYTGSDPNALVTLYRLYVHFGDRENAGMALRQFVDQNPEELWALRELVAHYRQVHDQDRYISALEELIEKAPNRQAFADLMGHYRLNGEVEKEVALFETGRRQGLADEDDTLRAGLILASQGHLDGAMELLRSIDVPAGLVRERAQLTVLQILIDLDRLEEAFELALEIQDSSPGRDQGSLASTFDQAGRADYATRLRQAAEESEDPEERS